MARDGDQNDYHSLLSLHHGLRLRRALRGDIALGGERGPAPTSPLAEAPTVDHWPQRSDDQRALRESLLTVEPLPDTLLAMYNALFRERPHVRGLFPGSILAQRARLTHFFLGLIDALDHPLTIVSEIRALGRDHRKLGVLPQHYTAFAEALTEALRVAGADKWRAEYERAWLRLYWFTARLMIEAAEQVTSEPPYFSGAVVGHERRRRDLAVVRVRTSEPYPFRPGQHATVESPLLRNTWRCYSIANQPGEDFLEFHIRAKGVGGVSDVLVERTRVGDRLRLGMARGHVTAASLSGAEALLLVAGGTGLAPIRSIVGEVGRWARPPRTVLFFGVRRRADLYDLDGLAGYVERAPWLQLVPAVSDGAAMPFESGDLPDVVARYGPWHRYRSVVAGPPSLVEALLRTLPPLGVPAQQVLHNPE